MTIQKPEKECKTIPKSFSEESKIISVETDDYRRGIIFDSLEEFIQALIVYNGSSVEEARVTQKNLMDAVRNQYCEMGADLLLLGRELNARVFMERLIEEVVSELEPKGIFNIFNRSRIFYRSFDYDALGTNFFKTKVEGRKVGNKYVLELYALYAGREPEEKLAKILGKPRALASSNVIVRLSIIGGQWFNVNLEEILKSLPISKKILEKLPEYFVTGRYYKEKPKMTFKHNRQKFALDLDFYEEGYPITVCAKQSSEYMQVRGKNIVGRACEICAKNEDDINIPKVVYPAVVISVSLPGKRYPLPVAVTEDQIRNLQAARDYLTDLIKEN